jgi:hypothetical protein
MAGLVPAIHALLADSPKEDVDARMRGHDVEGEPIGRTKPWEKK